MLRNSLINTRFSGGTCLTSGSAAASAAPVGALADRIRERGEGAEHNTWGATVNTYAPIGAEIRQ